MTLRQATDDPEEMKTAEKLHAEKAPQPLLNTTAGNRRKRQSATGSIILGSNQGRGDRGRLNSGGGVGGDDGDVRTG